MDCLERLAYAVLWIMTAWTALAILVGFALSQRAARAMGLHAPSKDEAAVYADWLLATHGAKAIPIIGHAMVQARRERSPSGRQLWDEVSDQTMLRLMARAQGERPRQASPPSALVVDLNAFAQSLRLNDTKSAAA